MGWHVCKVGSRFAALEPIAQGLGRLYGSVEADVARGLALRMDHGSQYLSDHFLNQLRYWGIHPSFGFVEEPETNGVVERWNRTLKEQAVYGRVFRNLAEVRAAVAEFVVRYNQCWRLEKLAYRTPLEAREEYTSYAKPRSVNVCPRNRVRYKSRPRTRVRDVPTSVLSQWFVTDVTERVRQVQPPVPGPGTSVAFFGDGTLEIDDEGVIKALGSDRHGCQKRQ